VNGDWADDPSGAVGAAAAGPLSIDVFTLPDGSLGAVGTYRGPVGFDGDPPASTLPLTARDSTGIYYAVYRELGGIATLINIGGVAGAGTLSVSDAAVDTAGGFTVIGTFTGTASFARRDGSVISLAAQGQSIFIAHYDANANITWVWRGSGPPNLTADSVASYDDRSVIAIGSMGAGELNLIFTDPAGNRLTAPGGSAGVWAARFAANGAGAWAERAVSQTGVATARGVTTHEDGRATLTGEFLGSASLGPNRELSVLASNANDTDVWFVDLKPAGEFSWGGSLGAVGADLAGDVARGPAGGTELVANTLGANPKAVSSSMSHALASVTPNMLQTHVIGIDATGLMQRAALIGDRNGKNRARGYRIEPNTVGVFTVGGIFNADVGFYGNVGLVGGTPATPDFTIASLFNGPATLFVADVDNEAKFSWGVQAGGDNSGMTTAAGWDVVMTTHASGSISLGGMFATISVFGDQVPEQLTTMSPGNPFVVHVNSQAEYDYCP
jgi:hypothetical protein